MRFIRVLCALTSAVALGCSPDPSAPAEAVVREPAIARPRIALAGLDEARGTGGAVVIATIGDRKLVFAADADDMSIVTFDPKARAAIGRHPLPAAAEQLVVGADGLLYATLRDRNLVLALEATSYDGELHKKAEIQTETEPVALAATPEALLVLDGWGHALESFRYGRGSRDFVVDLPREPRGLSLSRDGRSVFVAHMVGSRVSVVDVGGAGTGDVERHEARWLDLRGGDISPPSTTCDPDGKEHTTVTETARVPLQGYAVATFEDRVLFPGVLVRTGDPSVRTGGYGVPIADLPSEIFSVSVTDRDARQATRPSLHVQMAGVTRSAHGYRPCLLPRAAAVDASRGSLFVACLDSDLVLELDARAPDPARAIKRRFPVAQAPSGVAVDEVEREAYAFSSFTGAMDVLVLGDAKKKAGDPGGYYKTARVQLREATDVDHLAASRAYGRALFHRSGNGEISRDGRACASCHPDGRDDGLVWPTPNGPRQAPMLAGRLEGTAPYSWTNGHARLEDHLAQTIHRLGGTGLDKLGIAALVDYLQSLEGPNRRAHLASSEVEERGRALFSDPSVGCAECHAEGRRFTDGAAHDVSSRAHGDVTALFDTPSLRFVGGTGPYFHDGRFSTLADLLRETDGVMGTTAHLDDGDVAALSAYVETL